MPQLKSRTAADIRKDKGAPQAISPDEQSEGAGMDNVERDTWPEGEDITSDLTPGNSKGSSGVQRKTGQLGTT